MKLIPSEHIEQRIYWVRGFKVMLDTDLALVYGVTTKRLNEQVRRNKKRFPPDFMFELSQDELHSLRSQNATLDKPGRGRHRKYLPYVFTEHGAVMVASVLNTAIAIEASVQIARAFVKLRELVSTHKELAKQLAELEEKVSGHDEAIGQIFLVIKQLVASPVSRRRKIGFAPSVPND